MLVRPAMKRLFCLKAKNGLGRFAPSALTHYKSPPSSNVYSTMEGLASSRRRDRSLPAPVFILVQAGGGQLPTGPCVELYIAEGRHR